MTLAGLIPHVIPEEEIDSVTFPVKLLTGVTLIVEVPVAPANTVAPVGLEETVKLLETVTLRLTRTNRDRELLVAVIFIAYIPGRT